MASRQRKYRNQPTIIAGRRFDSKAEAMRYLQLLSLVQAGEIEQLECQVRYPLKVNGELICTYVADFRYLTSGLIVVEDVKGFATREYKLKKKLMLAIHGIKIQEVRL
jgi:hypothetical protein